MYAQFFHIITFGCQMNVNDSSWLSRSLSSKGYQEGPLEKADIVIVNTCSVREKPEAKVHSILGAIRQIKDKERNVLVAVTGCVAQQLGSTLFNYSPQIRLVAGSDATAQIPTALEELLDRPKEKLCLTDFTTSYIEREDVRTTPAEPCSYVNIMQGCDNFCTYCIVPFTKGRQKSRSSQAVLAECSNLATRGAVEITLLGQNVNAYGRDDTGDGTSFAELLRKVANLDGIQRLRYVTPHPKDMTQQDIMLFADLKKLCPRLHLPVQSGSDRILKRMNRRYDSQAFLRLVELLHAAQPDLVLSTDLIVGFPGETEEDFQATLNLVRAAGFVSSYSFCYSDRPGTKASLFPDKIPNQIKLDRLKRLQVLQDGLTCNWLTSREDTTTEVLLEHPSPRQNVPNLISWQGRDPYGALIHIPLAPGREQAGNLVKVKITKALRHSLQAEELKS